MMLIEVAVNVNHVTVWSRLRDDRVFKLSASRLILHIIVNSDSHARSIVSTLGWATPTLILSLLSRLVLSCLDFLFGLSLQIPLSNRLVSHNASVYDSSEKVEDGQDNRKVSETLFGINILDVVTGIETEQVDCNHCHYFVENLLDVPLFRIKRSVGYDEYHVGKIQQER